MLTRLAVAREKKEKEESLKATTRGRFRSAEQLHSTIKRHSGPESLPIEAATSTQAALSAAASSAAATLRRSTSPGAPPSPEDALAVPRRPRKTCDETKYAAVMVKHGVYF